jgi:5'-deoxynucleotidase YfbR-like HD superfamily hydrolase
MKMKRAWQRMLSGRRLEILNPSPLDIEIEDIAHGLSFLARWNGQTIGDYPFSVAQHSLLVENIFSSQFPKMDNESKLFALLHDSAEYVISDMISPLKTHLGMTYETLDEKLTMAICIRFNIPTTKTKIIKKQVKLADKMAAWLEAIQLAGFSEQEADSLFGKKAGVESFEDYLSPDAPFFIRKKFVNRFNELYDSSDKRIKSDDN